jgi:hypothetical protein
MPLKTFVNMNIEIKFPQISDERKMKLLERLVKEGHITLDEAFLLAEAEYKFITLPQQEVLNPPFYPSWSPNTVPNMQPIWFGNNNNIGIVDQNSQTNGFYGGTNTVRFNPSNGDSDSLVINNTANPSLVFNYKS